MLAGFPNYAMVSGEALLVIHRLCCVYDFTIMRGRV